MGGLLGVISEKNLFSDLFYGLDYHSHLGTEIGGIAFLNDDIYTKCDNISNSQFKSIFQKEFEKTYGLKSEYGIGIGVISDRDEEQPLKFESKIGTYALCTSGLINNVKELYLELLEMGATFKKTKFISNEIVFNQTEIAGELINQGENILDGIEKMYEKIEGDLSLVLLSKNDACIFGSGGTFPLIVGHRQQDWIFASETAAFPNLGYKIFKFPTYREILSIDKKGIKTRKLGPSTRKFCPFLLIYFGFPTSDYYGINSEIVRERCGGLLAEKDQIKADLILGIADSGFPHAIGYAKKKVEIARKNISAALHNFIEGKIDLDNFNKCIKESLDLVPPLRRPLVKYTPSWGRSYIPPTQEKREIIANYKQISNPQIIKSKKIILVDDSIRRGTQLQNLIRDKILLFEPLEIHGRIASPPQMFPCIFDLSTQAKSLATSKAIEKIESEKNRTAEDFIPEKGEKYQCMVNEMARIIGFTTLKFLTVEELIKAVIEAPNNVGLREEDLCLSCWTGIP